MKRILVLLLVMSFSLTSFSQTEKTEDTLGVDTNKFQIDSFDNSLGDLNKPQFYISTGVGIPNTSSFSDDARGFVEVGVMKSNIAYGLVVGRSNFNFDNDELSNYWAEAKIATYFDLGMADGYGFVAIGNYFDTPHIFTEYGVGISKDFKSYGLYIQVAKCDVTTYISPGIYFTL